MEEKLNLYEKTFGESFPTFMFASKTEEELEDIIDHCLDAERDVYSLGYLKDDPNIDY